MANLITFLRILLSLVLLCTAPLSLPFYVIYILAGLSDMADGALARKLKLESAFGAKLDTLADFSLFAVCFIRLSPVLDLPKWVYIWTAIIAGIKIINIVSGVVYQKKFVSVHSSMNKLTGLMLFLLPLTISFFDIKLSAAAVCTAATFAAIEEGHLTRTGKY